MHSCQLFIYWQMASAAADATHVVCAPRPTRISAIPPPTPLPSQSCAPRRYDEANAPRHKTIT